MRVRALLLMLLLGAVLALVGGVGVGSADAAPTFPSARVADLAATHVGQRGGECWTFAQNMILAAGGRNISAAAGGGDYFAHLSNAGGVPVADQNSLARGDVVQIGRYGGHTLIIAGRLSPTGYTVIDSNHAWTGMVATYPRTVVLSATTRAFRFGAAPTAGPAPAPGPSISAAPGRVFTVQNTSEQPPDGVWFRDNPAVPGPRLNGFGVYQGDRVQLACYGWGQPIGPYADRLWYRAANLTRPTAPGRPNTGWINAHFVNDGQNANIVDPGIPAC